MIDKVVKKVMAVGYYQYIKTVILIIIPLSLLLIDIVFIIF